MKKRLVAIFIALCAVVSAVPAVYASEATDSSAASEVTDSYGVVYTASDDGTYAIVADGIDVSGAVTIPAQITIGGKNLPVTTIARGAFKNSSVTSVNLHKGIINIHDEAFANCSLLTKVNFYSAPVMLGNKVFAGCGVLSTFSSTTAIISAGEGTFEDTASYKSKVSAGATEIKFGKCLYKYLGKASSYTVASSVISIAPGAFEKNTNLTSVTLGSSLTTIGNRAFKDCTSLKTLKLNSVLESIGTSAFDGCTSLGGDLVFPATVKSIGGYAFRGTAITSADMGAAALISVPNGAFINNTVLSSAIFADSVLNIGYAAFSGCSSLSEFSAPSVIFIDYDAFRGCTALGDKTMFANAEVIMSGAFDGTSIYAAESGMPARIGYALYKTEQTALPSLAVEKGIKQVSPYAFYNAENMGVLAFPESLEGIDVDSMPVFDSLTVFSFSSSDDLYRDLELLDAGTVYTPEDEVLSSESIAVGTIKGIRISQLPTKTEYAKGEEFDPTGMVVMLDAELDGETKSFDISEIGYSPDYIFDSTSSTTLTVDYCGYTTTVDLAEAGSDIIYGDLNSDKFVDTDDLVLLRKVLAGLVSASELPSEKAADLNSDGTVNTDDLVILRKVIAGLITV